MLTSHNPVENHILAALPPDEFEHLSPYLELTPVSTGDILCESGSCLRHSYFPVDSIVSLLYVMQDGATAEIAAVGNEGIVGLPLVMGGDSALNRAIVRSPGYVYRLSGHLLKQEFSQSNTLQHLLLLYMQALLTQVAQTAICNRRHTVEQQLCRWLLLTADRLPSNELTTTQEFIANMLGVRREGITEAAGRLQNSGLIQYSRGHITIIDRSNLEAHACECYGVVKKEFDRLLPHSH